QSQPAHRGSRPAHPRISSAETSAHRHRTRRPRRPAHDTRLLPGGPRGPSYHHRTHCRSAHRLNLRTPPHNGNPMAKSTKKPTTKSTTKPSPKAPASTAERTYPNILLIAIDSLLSDHMSCYGYPRLTTPHIDSFAAQGTVFENTYSAHVPTTPAY